LRETEEPVAALQAADEGVPELLAPLPAACERVGRVDADVLSCGVHLFLVRPVSGDVG
jgi:hypothetical protein